MKHLPYIWLIAFCLIGQIISNAQSTSAYRQSIDDWHAKREQNLRAESGWLNLAGLYWLTEGKSSFGSAKTNKIVFPEGTIAGQAGYFERIGNTVKLLPAKGVEINIDDQPARDAVVFNPDSNRTLRMASGDLRWVIIKREDRIGIRLRNLKSPLLESFHGIERFDVDSTWRATATLHTKGRPAEIPITNVIGQTTPQKSAGQLTFKLHGKSYTLDALDEDDDLFIVFSDETSGESTYPGGRFITVKKPGPDGRIVLDFNMAYNPPCAFTAFATCPLPPVQNRLKVAITAGEKNYGHH